MNVMKIRWFGKRVMERYEYASKEEFVGAFERERVGLQRLALMLTKNSETAKLCLIRAFRECVAGSSVSKGWILTWARRVVIRNAISLVTCPGHPSFVNTNDDADSGLIAFSPDDSLGAIAEFESIFGLPEFDRLVFVICVLEHYSIHDCALLLGKSPREINEVRYRVGDQVGQIDEFCNSSRHFDIRKLHPSTAGK
jgi:DNA-directed RNA polymerase specialized sigma24 family protein